MNDNDDENDVLEHREVHFYDKWFHRAVLPAFEGVPEEPTHDDPRLPDISTEFPDPSWHERITVEKPVNVEVFPVAHGFTGFCSRIFGRTK